jgi:hypothetical protein
MPPRDRNQAPDLVSEPRPIEVNALGISYQVNLGGDRQVSFETKLDSTADKVEIDTLLDTIHASVDRQQARIKLPEARGRLNIAHVQLRLHEREYAKEEAMQSARFAVSRKQGEMRRSEAQIAKLSNIQTSIDRFRADIPILEWEIERLQAVIDGTDIPPEPERLAEAAD